MSNSYDKIIDKVFDGFKKLTPALAAVAIATGLVLFLPSPLLASMGMAQLPNIIIMCTGFLFLLSCTLVVTIISSIFFKWLYMRISRISKTKRMRKYYGRLSAKHKRMLVELLSSDNKAMELDSTSGDVRYLVDYGFIYRPVQATDAFNMTYNLYTYVPRPWLVHYYEECPEAFK